MNVIADDGPRPVRSDGLAAIRVKVDCDGGLEARGLEAVVKPASSGVEADRAESTSVPVPRFRGRTPPQSFYGSRQK